ncbi:anthranilate synthase component I [Thermospira aquatica]|uniref:Anthranilate synthase component 1 n=1 Tax=Thermospira aquatica TaxID=2828656 RepID=A0AAX3BDC1_9SPIR|nr:anthranilate synthase component I [Thermospira aquatica]URA10113.1 anthranilate synthase component I [Thermospira aquatica]
MKHVQLQRFVREIPSDMLTPVVAFHALRENSTQAFLLESVEMGEMLGRYSFLGFEPAYIFRATGNAVEIITRGEVQHFTPDNVLGLLKEFISSFSEEGEATQIPFTAGLVGYLSYDAVRYMERLPDIKPYRFRVPDIYFVLPRVLVVFDHIRQKISLITYRFDNESIDPNEKLKRYEERLYQSHSLPKLSSQRPGEQKLLSNFKREDFLQAVQKAKEYIVAGDIFQLVLSQRFRMALQEPSFSIYRKLRMINPSPYMFYMEFGDFQIVGSSPEVMVKRTKRNGIDEVLLRPIAGTRPRGKTREEDEKQEQDLLSDIKERAEHTMLLDLGRNDLGRIAQYGGVRVERPFHIERYSHVMHIVSDVIATPRDNIHPLDILSATFPAGTVSGAPKIRAMEIIEELEPEKRGIYAGAVGYIDFRGNLDTGITIRTIVCRDGMAYFQAGAGIVYDSIPEREYEETINKARALMTALL